MESNISDEILYDQFVPERENSTDNEFPRQRTVNTSVQPLSYLAQENEQFTLFPEDGSSGTSSEDERDASSPRVVPNMEFHEAATTLISDDDDETDTSEETRAQNESEDIGVLESACTANRGETQLINRHGESSDTEDTASDLSENLEETDGVVSNVNDEAIVDNQPVTESQSVETIAEQIREDALIINNAQPVKDSTQDANSLQIRTTNSSTLGDHNLNRVVFRTDATCAKEIPKQGEKRYAETDGGPSTSHKRK